jgi:diacylglycerol kinase family enzyme
MTAITTTGYLVLGNETAGSMDPMVLFGATRPLADRAPTEVRLVTSTEDLERALADLGDRTPVIAGGDGTVHRVVARLRRTVPDRPVGILPSGTANDFARGLGLPTDPEQAARRIVQGAPRAVTLLEVETDRGAGESTGAPSSVVCNAVHLGAGVRGARLAGRLKAALGRASYPLATAISGLVSSGIRGLTVEVDGRPWPVGAPLVVLVANGGRIGGSGALLPRTEADRPGARLVAVPAGPRLRRVGAAVDAVRGRLLARTDVSSMEGTVIELRRPDGLEVDVDGELEAWGSWCRLTARPGALWVLDSGGHSGRDGDDDRGDGDDGDEH